MARLYANENFPVEVVKLLRAMGHDVISTHDAGNSNRGIEDGEVLNFAINDRRCVIPLNRTDFVRLHPSVPRHFGIIVCTENRDYQSFAARIDSAIRGEPNLSGKRIKVVRGA